MNQNFLQTRSVRFLLGMALVFAMVFSQTAKMYGINYTKPAVPQLTLTGQDGGWDANWYPDGRIWLPPSSNGPREFLLPVFIENRWHTYTETQDKYQVQPIKSFQFTVLYDSAAVRVVDVQKFGSKDHLQQYSSYFDDNGNVLAKDFNISWNDDYDWSYKLYLNPNTPFQDYSRGRGVRIVGTSNQPLPNTDLYSDEYKVLLYIRFQVIPQEGHAVGIAMNTPIIIKNDTIKYNDMNVCKQAPFESMRNYDAVVQQDYPDPGPYTGLAGVDNSTDLNWSNEPTLPGVIYLRLTDKVPDFGFSLDRGVGQQPQMSEISPGLWDIADPITIDYNSQYPYYYGSRIFQVKNAVTTTRLLDVSVETDQPWLLVRTLKYGPNSISPLPLPAPTRAGYINYIDNGILGENYGTAFYGQNSTRQGDIYFEVRCDPTKLSPNSEDMTGMYVGYITFKSSTASINPVRVRVSFLYFDIPLEGRGNSAFNSAGIHLMIHNSNKPVQDSTNLIFGTGTRASLGIDSLYGEYAYLYGMDGGPFAARFFPPPNSPAAFLNDPNNANLVNYGFGDFAPDDDNTDDSPKRSLSRDIRSANDTSQSITYFVKIYDSSPADYPLVVSWDVADFPDGATLYLHDILNGVVQQGTDMRQATNNGGTRYSYTIEDARISSFIIEYTLPKVINYVDQYGLPIIKKGWNLLSLPVRPTNSNYDVVYPRVINKPYTFTQNQYQDAQLLTPGRGYWMKYSDSVDKQFSGTYIDRIEYPTDQVLLYPGWNLIGDVSAPLQVADIHFYPYYTQIPTSSKVRAAGVWGYVTNQGYQEVSELEPGLGYWLWVDQQGYLDLVAPGHRLGATGSDMSVDPNLSASSKLQVTDNANHTGTLYLSNNSNVDLTNYSMPPLPPSEAFDLRFARNTRLDNSALTTFTMQAVSYPVNLTMANANATYTFSDAATGRILGTIAKGSTGSVKIQNTFANAIKVAKSDMGMPEFSIEAYPNPIDQNATIKYSVPENQHVTIKLYDQLGQEISTIVDADVNGGMNTVNFDASNIPSGSYIARITAGGNTTATSVKIVR